MSVSQIAECQKLGYLPCVSIYDGCTNQVGLCGISCSTSQPCPTGCCINYLCYKETYCQQQKVSSGEDPIMIMAIVLPICLAIFMIIVIITVRYCVKRRIDRIRAQRVQNLKGPNQTTNLNMNRQMILANQENVVEANRLQVEQQQQLQQYQLYQQQQFQQQQQFYDQSNQNYPQQYAFISPQQPAIYGVAISPVYPMNDQEQQKQASQLKNQNNNLVVGKTDYNNSGNVNYL